MTLGMLKLMTEFPACKALTKEKIKKGWSSTKIAMLLRVRFNRKRAGSARIDEHFIGKLERGEVYAPDTLRSQIASILGLTEKQTFPEYMIACQKLREERIGREWTQSYVALRAREAEGRKLRDAEISAYERGSKYCHLGARQTISRIFNMPESELFPEYQDVGNSQADDAIDLC